MPTLPNRRSPVPSWRKRKEIFRLSREENLTNKEIAEMLGISVRTVEKSIELTLKEIRKVIPS